MRDLNSTESVVSNSAERDTSAAHEKTSGAALLLVASAALGLLPSADLSAQSAPTEGSIELQFSRYEEFQDQAARMRINAPSVFVVTPLGSDWSAEAFLTTDSMSGASPLYHDTLSGASGEGVEDFRKAGQFALTRYFARSSLTANLAFSDEDDYLSRAAGLTLGFDSEDRNRTITVGAGLSFDDINPTNDLVRDQNKVLREFGVGLTQVLDAQSLVAVNLGFAHGEGYFNDPYKPLDRRPDGRDEMSLSAKYHRSLQRIDSVLRVNYRFYRDTWAIRAHTLDVALEKDLGAWTLTPSLRWYSQSEADFYVRPPFGLGFRPGFNYSADARLSSFGSIEYGIKLALPELAQWRPEVKFAFYEQKQSLGLGDSGPKVELPSARTWQINLKRTF